MSRSVLLVYPRVTSGWQVQPRIEIPMGLLCLAGPLRAQGYDVRILDQRVEADWRAALRKELERRPVCVGVSSMTGPQIRHALEVSRFVKAAGRAPVVWGGLHATILPEQTLAEDAIDYVVEGDGEETFPELVGAIEASSPPADVKGVWFKTGGRVVHAGRRPHAPPDEQPPLDYELLDLGKYLRVISGLGHLNVMTSRGCTRACTFCFTAAAGSKRWRAMHADAAVERIASTVRTYGVRGVTFIDNDFFADMERGRRILRGLVREDLRLRISKISIPPDTLLRMTADDLGLLADAGCRRLTIAVETGSARMQDLLNKRTDLAALRDLNRRLRGSPLAPHYLFMIGLPTETKEDLAASVSLALELLEVNPEGNALFNIYTPFPGTRLFDLAVQHGLRPPERLEDWASCDYRNLAQGGPWLPAEVRRIVEMLDFCGFFIGREGYLQSGDNTNPLVRWLSRGYAPVAKWRIRSLQGRFPIEIKLARALGLYANQT
jgi:anaerobic magnesium-protoporphyrin IX monomethyl ester cyclase